MEKIIPRTPETKKVRTRADNTSSNGEGNQKIVNTKPPIIAAIAPILEKFFQKKTSRITADNVLPTPAQAQLTISNIILSEVRAKINPANPTMITSDLDMFINCLSDKDKPIPL